jgi:hypothetical protein
MRLIIHIGTHKTGTTALQQFLHVNRETFEARGFHYATPRRSVRDANSVANALNVGETRLVRVFLEKHVDLARRRGAHTMFVSSENFYAMSVQAAMQRRQVCIDAVGRDRSLIRTLGSLIPECVSATQIICYFRRPDRYAESLYAQHVKRGITFDGTFEEFFPIIEPALVYGEYMRAWADTFGRDNCIVRQYERVGADIVRDFLPNILNIDDLEGFVEVNNQANERIGRDLLEFKRLRNRTARFNEKDIERTIVRLVEEKMELRKAEPEYYQEFLSPDRRAGLLRLIQREIETLRAAYGIPPFPPFDFESERESWRPYPGLDRRRRVKIELEYNRIGGRIGFRLERLALRSASRLRRSVPATGLLLDALKNAGAKRAVHGFLDGMQGRSA